jgi:hypothetical protein
VPLEIATNLVVTTFLKEPIFASVWMVSMETLFRSAHLCPADPPSSIKTRTSIPKDYQLIKACEHLDGRGYGHDQVLESDEELALVKFL